MTETVNLELVWLKGEVKSPPFSPEARLEAGFLLRKLQMGESLSMPHSRPMPIIGSGCHELRIQDKHKTWRIIYLIDVDAIVIGVWVANVQRVPLRNKRSLFSRTYLRLHP